VSSDPRRKPDDASLGIAFYLIVVLALAVMAAVGTALNGG
jgi:hypothetical protein